MDKTTHPAPREAFARRLIGMPELAEKIGYSRDWLYRHRDRLEAIGFPPPALSEMGGRFLRWDERAIDLWLDSKIPEELRDRDRIRIDVADTHAIEQRLAARAQEIAL